MERSEKERIVAELSERLRASETLIVADYRGLSTKDLEALRAELARHGARFAVVKNTLTRRAAEAAGADALLALLEGPSALAFLEAEGDPVAVAKSLRETARSTRVLAIRGGVLDGRPMTAAEVEELANVPPVDVLRGQVLGAVTAPLIAIVGLFTAPLRDLAGLVDARIQQLEEQGAGAGEAVVEPEPEAEAVAEPAAETEAAAPEQAAEGPTDEVADAAEEPQTETQEEEA